MAVSGTRLPGSVEVASAVEAVERAFADTDHTRLPSWLVAQIAVESAAPSLEAEFCERHLAPLNAELAQLRDEVRRLTAHTRRPLRSV